MKLHMLICFHALLISSALVDHQLRLPEFAVPESYSLSLRPDLQNSNFTGSIQVQLRILEETPFLVLNAVNLSIELQDITYTYIDKVVQPIRSSFNLEDEVFIIEFEQKLPKGIGNLSIGLFRGLFDENLIGFYRSEYESNGKMSYMAVTQFEPTYARRCFPCWDEPALKAKFTITLELPAELTPLSNMPILNENVHGTWKTVKFQQTPVMSTYLVAVVIGKFDFIESSTTEGVTVRVYTPIGKSTEGEFGLNVAVQSLQLYHRLFSVPYPLPKLDMVGIPQFHYGAMENFGLVTYQSYLLYVNKTSGYERKHMVAETIAHELGHQWCGNIVTMKWWTDVWLNEGFATWLSAYALDHIFPEWNEWFHFVYQTTFKTLTIDTGLNTHPVEVIINNTNDIQNSFDSIVYNKGACVVRMIQSYLGSEVFKVAMASYIKEYYFSNANTGDLWNSLQGSSGKPVKHVMSKWTNQRGFPILSVESTQAGLILKQVPFGSGENQSWVVPVSLACGSYDVHHQFLLDVHEMVVHFTEIVGCSCSHKSCPWIKLNVNQTGYYRVRYSKALLSRLEFAVSKNYLSISDQYGLLNDLKALNQTQTTASMASRMIPREFEKSLRNKKMLIVIWTCWLTMFWK